MCFYSIEGFLRILLSKIMLYGNPRNDRSKKYCWTSFYLGFSSEAGYSILTGNSKAFDN